MPMNTALLGTVPGRGKDPTQPWAHWGLGTGHQLASNPEPKTLNISRAN